LESRGACCRLCRRRKRRRHAGEGRSRTHPGLYLDRVLCRHQRRLCLERRPDHHFRARRSCFPRSRLSLRLPVRRLQQAQKGAFGGLQAGYNWQVNPNFVAGIEADIQAAGIRGTGTTPVFLAVGLSQIQADQKVKWFGTIRGRLGVLPTERILAYVTGGLAAGRVEESASYFAGNRGGVTVNGVGFDCIVAYPECFSGTSARTAVGWTAGAGLEIAAWQNITIKAEYLYVNLGGGANLTATALAAPPGIARSTFIASYGRADFNLFRVGLNYRFDPPVVARY